MVWYFAYGADMDPALVVRLGCRWTERRRDLLSVHYRERLLAPLSAP
ncbi:hypothetical protein [Spirochaeta thermophila]|nr:hypothetical protein [Spirochaeta thermophila]